MMSEVLQRLHHLEKQPVQPPLQPPPLLPTPSSTQTHHNASPSTPTFQPSQPTTPITLQPPPQTFTAMAPSTQLRMPKLEIPVFSGANPLSWLFQIERFFLYHNTPLDHRLSVASFYMSGTTLQWFHWLYNTNQLTTWADFTAALNNRFGPSNFLNYEASLFKLKQSSSLEQYIEDFEALSTRTTGLSQLNLLNCFISGVKDDIQRELLLLRPQTLREAMGMAKVVNDKLAAAKPIPSKFTPRFNPTPNLISQPKPTTTTPTPPLPIRRLTPVEMRARREKGLCYNCDDKFVPGHKCNRTRQFLCLTVDDDDINHDLLTLEGPPTHEPPLLETPTETPAPDLIPAISLHAFAGHEAPMALRLEGSIAGSKVIVLVDGGSTHNFIQARIARFLNLPIQPAPSMTVTVGNGDSLHCAGFCKNVSLSLGSFDCTLDLHVLSLYGADVVLGVQWLKSLGRTTFDYNDLYLEFFRGSDCYRLMGLRPSSCMQLFFAQLQKITKSNGVAGFFHLSLSENSQPPTTVNPTIPPELAPLLKEFSAIFAPPVGLPPTRPTDHTIPLLPGSHPVNVRPYRYPHFQNLRLKSSSNKCLRMASFGLVLVHSPLSGLVGEKERRHMAFLRRLSCPQCHYS
ncbi:hypothetical protein Syun_030890 [Stephania yunnanensis]|uniref:Retrotransposon gag domain-containing protein n=1 Tax=Stephania yunnanensis TaxID=152371 RepID=A0AAP0HEJ9_9MAGN